MENFSRKVTSFFQDEEGLTVVEYVLGAALMIAAMIIVFGNLGDTLKTKLSTAVDKIS
ncbi:Flp family type IVb pilin [Vibrio breoganii]|uniref:Flp family type IVb pilin n=1 Tax=Vibrio breoganii TaxID=553239 RepID=UPI000C8621E7|nr:Flp family type IVb pilin [Vibrio breoganii]PMJ44522.1 fimbrial protein [Vibrio breoganii]PMK51758.1 fimbrial protein [Vibrio breoganii]PMO26939.1 fimbrial protein [Vibrio breoganii]PMO28465.1 fimbrial protein [Vibrio breoganii]PMO66881.1 fimbrial protein [Vibrio breoganii]